MSRLLLACGLAAAVSIPGGAWAVDMTDETKKLLEQMNLSEDILAGQDEELAIPQEWVDKAMAEEGELLVRGNADEIHFQQAKELFEARYPYIKASYVTATGAQGSTQPRLSYIQGNIVMDVSFTIGREHALWVEIDGFEDITDLPAISTLIDGGLAEDNLTVAYSTNPYCIAYNTEKYKKEDMPATWDDLVATDKFGNGVIGLNVNYTVWLPYLVSVNGSEWGEQYMDKLFALKPSLRREGFTMMSKLVGLGEFGIAIPQADKQVARSQAEGVAIAWHCPTPVPLGVTEAAIIKGNPRPYQSKIFLNWLMSKESQLVAYKESSQQPAHKDLIAEFSAFPDETRGKQMIPKNMKIIDITEKMIDPWGKRFESAGQ
jgi:iron(III) transport system substrate-binding protein